MVKKMNHIKEKDVSELDLTKMFLHYTNKNNLENIFKKGLIPKVGENSKGIEKHKKIFFSEGIEASLIIMDIWINWLILKPKNKYIYRIGAFLLERNFPKEIYVFLFNKWKNSDRKLNYACQKLNDILEESIYLVLDLKENIDFSYTDLDEVKSSKFPNVILKYFYDNRSDIKRKTLEKWNMHTYINKTISREKISVLKYKEEYNAKKLLFYFIENKLDFVKENCKLLYYYYKLYQ